MGDGSSPDMFESNRGNALGSGVVPPMTTSGHNPKAEPTRDYSRKPAYTQPPAKKPEGLMARIAAKQNQPKPAA